MIDLTRPEIDQFLVSFLSAISLRLARKIPKKTKMKKYSVYRSKIMKPQLVSAFELLLLSLEC